MVCWRCWRSFRNFKCKEKVKEKFSQLGSFPFLALLVNWIERNWVGANIYHCMDAFGVRHDLAENFVGGMKFGAFVGHLLQNVGRSKNGLQIHPRGLSRKPFWQNLLQQNYLHKQQTTRLFMLILKKYRFSFSNEMMNFITLVFLTNKWTWWHDFKILK